MLIVFSCYKLRWKKPTIDSSWCSHHGHSFVIACVHSKFVWWESRSFIQSNKIKKKRKTHTQQRESQLYPISLCLKFYSKMYLKLYCSNTVNFGPTFGTVGDGSHPWVTSAGEVPCLSCMIASHHCPVTFPFNPRASRCLGMWASNNYKGRAEQRNRARYWCDTILRDMVFWIISVLHGG